MNRVEKIKQNSCLMALSVVLRYVQATQNYGARISVRELGSQVIKCDPIILEKFLQGQARGERQRQTQKHEFKKFLRACEVYCGRRALKDSATPDYIRQAIFSAFPNLDPRRDHEEAAYKRAVDEISELFVSYNLDGFHEKTIGLRTALDTKVYDIFRWAGPSSDDDPRVRAEPRAVRSSVKFFHPVGGGFVRFDLNYRPQLLGSAKWKFAPTRNCHGIVVPIGDHYLLIGTETNPRYPLIVLLDINVETPQAFGGIVLRKADSKAQILGSRVLFSENERMKEKAKKFKQEGGKQNEPWLKELDDQIGIVFKEDLPQEVGALLEEVFKNSTGFEGLEALTLKTL